VSLELTTARSDFFFARPQSFQNELRRLPSPCGGRVAIHWCINCWDPFACLVSRTFASAARSRIALDDHEMWLEALDPKNCLCRLGRNPSPRCTLPWNLRLIRREKLSVESDDESSTFRRSRPATQCARMEDFSYGSAYKSAVLLINRRELRSNRSLDRPFPSAYDCIPIGKGRWVFTTNEKREMSCSRVSCLEARRRCISDLLSFLNGKSDPPQSGQWKQAESFSWTWCKISSKRRHVVDVASALIPKPIPLAVTPPVSLRLGRWTKSS
jgi:hypothetical protein